MPFVWSAPGLGMLASYYFAARGDAGWLSILLTLHMTWPMNLLETMVRSDTLKNRDPLACPISSLLYIVYGLSTFAAYAGPAR
jgi:hypothetical protein